MKQETLKEAAKRLFPNEMEEYDIFLIGARWQQERSYSEEDMRTAWNSSEQNMRFNFSSSVYKNITFEQWFEQFKKK